MSTLTARERLHALWTGRGWSVHTGTTGRHGGPPVQWSASWTDENGVCDVAFGPTEEEACAALLAKLEPALPSVNGMKHPMQPIGDDGKGVARFNANAIVLYLLDQWPFDMNHLARMGEMWPKGDYAQFTQLIGYSVREAATTGGEPETLRAMLDAIEKYEGDGMRWVEGLDRVTPKISAWWAAGCPRSTTGGGWVRDDGTAIPGVARVHLKDVGACERRFVYRGWRFDLPPLPKETP